MDPAVGLLDDAVDRGQAQARALAHRLGGEERVEDLAHHLGRDAGAVVADLDERLVALGAGEAQALGFFLRQARRADAHHAAALGRPHRVAGVDGQVHDGGLELALVGPHLRQVAAIVGDQLDVFTEEAAQQDLELGDQLAQFQHFALHGLLAAEGQELADQVGGADAGLADLVEAFVRGIAHRVAVQQLVQAQLDGGQQVVEVVGHAAGQLADGLHLLGLGELQFHLLLLGHVDQIGHQPPIGAVEIEVGDPGRVAGQAHLERTGLALGQAALGVRARRRVDQGPEDRAGRDRPHHRRQGGIGLQDARVERVEAFQQGRAERRGAGEGVQGARGGCGLGDGRRWNGRGGHQHFLFDHGGQANQQAAAAQAGGLGLALGAGDHQHALGALTVAGLDQGREQAGAGRALGQAARVARGLHPGGVGGQDAAVGGGQGRGFGQGVEEGLAAFGFLVLDRRRGADGHQAQDRHPGDAAQQQKTRQGGRPGPQSRRGGEHRGQHQEHRRAPDQEVGTTLALGKIFHGRLGHGGPKSFFSLAGLKARRFGG